MTTKRGPVLRGTTGLGGAVRGPTEQGMEPMTRSGWTPTRPERFLRAELQRRGIPHEFQYPTRSGYIADFAFPDHRLIVEVDGEAWHSSSEARKRDRFRDYRLRKGGWTVLRFTATLVESDTCGVVDAVVQHLKS